MGQLIALASGFFTYSDVEWEMELLQIFGYSCLFGERQTDYEHELIKV